MRRYLTTAEFEQRLPSNKVAQKIASGWVWHRLDPGFKTGLATKYNRALISLDGEFCFVSNRAKNIAEVEDLPVFKIGYKMTRLFVPFKEIGDVSNMGATWFEHCKTWACPSEKISDFSRWASDHPVEIDTLDFDGRGFKVMRRMVLLSVPISEKNLAKEKGAIWAPQQRRWACRVEMLNDFKQWVNEEPEEFDLFLCF